MLQTVMQLSLLSLTTSYSTSFQPRRSYTKINTNILRAQKQDVSPQKQHVSCKKEMQFIRSIYINKNSMVRTIHKIKNNKK